MNSCENEKYYLIGDKAYVQRPLVLGQIKQLLAALKGVSIPVNVTTIGLIAALGDALPAILAIVLTEDGASLKGKNISVMAEEISFSISPETTLQVIEDFFDCNPIPLLLERIGKMTDRMMQKIADGSTMSASSSQGETSQNGMTSSGDTLQ